MDILTFIRLSHIDFFM